MTAVARLTRNQRGFTLSELLIVSAILGLMLAGLLTVQMQGQTSYLIGAHRVEAQQNARIALDLIIRELRSAQSITAIPSASDMTFVDEYGATVRYALSGTTINRTTGGVTTPLIGGAQAFILTYFSAFNNVTNTGTTTAAPASVRLIRVQFVSGTEQIVATYSAANQQATMESLVHLRNM